MSVPCSAIQACWDAVKASGRRRARQYANSSAEASTKRYRTLASGSTVPSWNVIAIQVEPQIATQAAKSCRVLTEPASLRQPDLVEDVGVGEGEVLQRVV